MKLGVYSEKEQPKVLLELREDSDGSVLVVGRLAGSTLKHNLIRFSQSGRIGRFDNIPKEFGFQVTTTGHIKTGSDD